MVGNPPYVRQELLGQIKPYLEEHFAAYHGMADLYVYFFERGLELLRPGGRLSFVVTNKWMKAGYGAAAPPAAQRARAGRDRGRLRAREADLRRRGRLPSASWWSRSRWTARIRPRTRCR